MKAKKEAMVEQDKNKDTVMHPSNRITHSNAQYVESEPRYTVYIFAIDQDTVNNSAIARNPRIQ